MTTSNFADPQSFGHIFVQTCCFILTIAFPTPDLVSSRDFICTGKRLEGMCSHYVSEISCNYRVGRIYIYMYVCIYKYIQSKLHS